MGPPALDAMPSPIPTVLDRARAAWLAGDRDAWAQYQACLRQLGAERPARDKPRTTRRARRPRARA